jgi:hypothetical protein
MAGGRFSPSPLFAMVPPISEIQRYTGLTAPAGLAVLARSRFEHGPKATNPPSILSAPLTPPKAGLYDANGLLPQIKGVGLQFLAYA